MINFSSSLLKQVPFNSRVAFSETWDLASLAQKGVLRKHLHQPVCRREDWPARYLELAFL